MERKDEKSSSSASAVVPPRVQLSKLSVLLLTITGLLPPRADVTWEKLVLSLEAAAPASFGAGLQLGESGCFALCAPW